MKFVFLLLAITKAFAEFQHAEFASSQIGIPKLPEPAQVLHLSPKKFANRNLFAPPKSPVAGFIGDYLGLRNEKDDQKDDFANFKIDGAGRFEEDHTKKIPPVKPIDIANVEKRILSEGTDNKEEDSYSSYPSITDDYTYYSTKSTTKEVAHRNSFRKGRRRQHKIANPYAQNFRAERINRIKATKKHNNKLDKHQNDESNLPYRPKYPASPYFGMCRLEDFEYDIKGNKIGRGGFGKVYSAVHKPTGIVVALKKVSVQSIRKNAKHVENEETIHHAIVHPFFAKHLCTMRGENGDIYFAMELVPGKNLAKRLPDIHPIPSDRLAKILAQMVVALEYLHSHCIIYRDLKAENVLLAPDGTVKFIDFGLSVHDCDNKMTNIAGTLEYTAPEMAARKKYGRAVDWYSLGILLYNLKMAKLPMTRRQIGDREAFLERISEGLEFGSTDDKDADDLIGHLTERDPRLRWGMTAETQKLIRAHPFFKSVDWKEIEGETHCAIQYPKLLKAVDLPEDEAVGA